jgi:hypothetical protein
MARVVKRRIAFTEIDTPNLVELKLDYTTDRVGGFVFGERSGDADSLVKVVVKFREDDSERVEQELAVFLDSARKVVRHVFPVEKQIVRSSRVRDVKMKRALSPLESFRYWMDSHEEEVSKLGRNELEGFFSTHADGAEANKCQPLAVARFMIENIGVEDYIPFAGKHEVVGLGRGVYGIVGTYEENPRRSNRAGKSALLKSVLTTLFGDDRSEMGRGESVDRDIHHGKEGYRVALGLHLGDAPAVQLERQRGHGGKIICHAGGAKMSVTALDAYVEGLLRFGKDDFTKISFVKAGDLNGIIGSGNSQMKSDLLRWLGLEYWEKIHSNVQREILQLQADIAVKKATADQLHQEWERLGIDLERSSCDELKAQIDEVRKQENEIVERVAEHRADMDRTRLKRERESLAAQLRKEIVQVEFEGKMYNPHMLQARLEDLVHEKKNERDGLIKQLSDLKSRGSQRSEMRDGFKKTGTCPIERAVQCPLKDRLVSVIEAGDEVDSKRAFAVRNTMLSLEAIEDCQGTLEDLLRSMSSRTVRAKTFRAKIEEIDGKLEGKKDGDDVEVDEMSEELQIVRDVVLRRERDLAAWNQTKLRYEEVNLQGQKIQKWIASNTEREGQLRFLRRACGRDGIPTMQLENALSVVEAGANTVLSMIEAPHRVAFSFQRELKKLEDSCHECGVVFKKSEKTCSQCGEERWNKKSEDISLEITDSNGRTQDFNQDSSGGRALVALALRVALAQHFGFNLLFLDEVCGSLDDENLDMLIRLLKRLTSMGFDQVFVISHRERIKDLLDDLIVVERDNIAGRSKFFLQG